MGKFQLHETIGLIFKQGSSYQDQFTYSMRALSKFQHNLKILKGNVQFHIETHTQKNQEWVMYFWKIAAGCNTVSDIVLYYRVSLINK